jgi:hypothetical protein
MHEAGGHVEEAAGLNVGGFHRARGSMGRAAIDCLQTPKAFVRPQLAWVVVDRVRRHALGQTEPTDLGACVDVDVWSDAGRVVQRASAHEPHPRSTVCAEYGDPTARTAEDPLHTAVITRHLDWLWCNCEDLDALRLDQQIDDEGAAGLALAVQAMTAMNEQWL